MPQLISAFIVGDVHGCLNELKAIIAKALPHEEIFICGDLIDRGLDSRGVIDYVRDNNIKVTLGNHELMAIECLPKIRYKCKTMKDVASYVYNTDWGYNGGASMINQYNSVQALITDIEFLDTFPVHITTDYKLGNKPLIVSHTLIADKLFGGFPVEVTVWRRDQVPSRPVNYFNVFGHTTVGSIQNLTTAPYPIIDPFKGTANIDTGAVYDTEGEGYLSAIRFPSLEVVQVKTNFNPAPIIK